MLYRDCVFSIWGSPKNRAPDQWNLGTFNKAPQPSARAGRAGSLGSGRLASPATTRTGDFGRGPEGLQESQRHLAELAELLRRDGGAGEQL